ncbi:MAG: hypothetical protein ACYC25_01515 [Paludibacter sp.]
MRKLQLMLLSFFMLINMNVQGQLFDELLNVKYKPGFAILNNGDTLRGAFEFNDCKQNYQMLVFVDPVTLTKSAYEPKEVKYFVLDSLTFQPKELKEGLVFVRLLLYDSLKVYLHKRFFTSSVSSGVENQIMYEKPNGKYLLVSFDNFFPFKTQVGNFFSDDPELSEKIENNTYTKKDIFKIALDYNKWLRRDTKKQHE